MWDLCISVSIFFREYAVYVITSGVCVSVSAESLRVVTGSVSFA